MTGEKVRQLFIKWQHTPVCRCITHVGIVSCSREAAWIAYVSARDSFVEQRAKETPGFKIRFKDILGL